jgi:general secretion pathway protein A
MYQNFYHLKKEPFHITPDPEFLFLSPSHKQALGAIIYGVKNRKGFVVITGEVGIGKTTILRSYLEKVEKPRVKIVYIFNANVTFLNLLKTIHKELGLPVKTEDMVEMLNNLYQVLMEEYKRGNTVLLIVDEAQNMPVETLENLRMLSNLETSKDKLLQIVLIGQSEFEGILNRHELRQLKQRIAIRSTIVPFTEKESLGYVEHRLRKASANGAPAFTKGALKAIAKEAKGIPRMLNVLCDNALITGFGYKVRPVNAKIANEVITDFTGEKRSSLLKWVLPVAAMLVFIVGLSLVYVHKDLIGSRVKQFIFPTRPISLPEAKNPGLSQAGEMNPGKEEEVKPSADLPETAQSGQSVTGQDEIQPAEETTSPEASRASSFEVRTVKKGDNLFKLSRSVYGFADEKLVALIRESNPWIKDINNIPVGREIIFPEVVEDQAKAKAKAKEP